MAAVEIVNRVYAPSSLVGKLYAGVYGSGGLLLPIGNVLEAKTAQTEEVEKQPDMTALGGGTYAEIRRVTGVKFTAKIADLNVTNVARAILGTIDPQGAGTVTAAPAKVRRGGLIALPHIHVSNLVMKKGGADVTAAPNYALLPEGVWVRGDATGLMDDDDVTLTYDFADQVVIEALTTKSPELVLRFAGLNEAASGRPVMFDLWRVSQGVTKQLSLLAKGFDALEVEGEVLKDPTKTGVGISPYMRMIYV